MDGLQGDLRMVLQSIMACDDNILNALEYLWHRNLSEEECDQMERFDCHLYKSKVYTQVNAFRWFLFFNRAAEGESVPPTTSSLTLHIQRPHYVVMIRRKAGGKLRASRLRSMAARSLTPLVIIILQCFLFSESSIVTVR